MQNAEKFLLVMPDYSDFPKLFIKNLEQLGFRTSLITNGFPDYKYKGTERIVNFYRKTFFKDRSYKRKLIADFQKREFLRIAEELSADFNYILVIRPDVFPISFIKKLKTKTEKFIAYQWDGIEKFPEVKKYVSFFDSFFCFETVPGFDGIKQTTNFYFDFDNFKPTQIQIKRSQPVFYFVGLDWEIRRKKIEKFVTFAINNGFKLDFYLQEFEKNEHKNLNIHYLKNRITFAENIELVKNADLLLDFLDPRQVGLSIRFFEGLYYRKKIITDNVAIRNYDFYHSNNILIIENDDYSAVEEFVKKPYYELPEDIVRKYGFSEWIIRILND